MKISDSIHLVWALLLFSASFVQFADAQEALRVSAASADAAEARRKASTTFGYYNLKIGPTGWHFSTALSLEGTDNVNLQEHKPEADVIIGPQLNTQMQWPLTELNSLNFNVGIGYSEYLKHSSFSRIFILPGTGLSLDLYVGEVWFNVHDMVSVTENAYQDPTVSGAGNYSMLGNDAGVNVNWDWNKGTVKLAYDHTDNIEITGGGSQFPSSGSELVSLHTGYAFRPETQIGLELSGGITHFSGTNAHDATQWSAGVFLDAPISDYIHFHGSAGYTEYRTANVVPGFTNTFPTTNGIIIIAVPTREVATVFNGLYAQISLSHRLNQYLNYTLSGGRSVSFSFYGGAVELYNVNWSGVWNIINNVNVSTSLTYEHGTQIGAIGAETFDRYGIGSSLGRKLTEKLSGGLTYQFYKRYSDTPGKGYTVNTLSLSFNYVF